MASSKPPSSASGRKGTHDDAAVTSRVSNEPSWQWGESIIGERVSAVMMRGIILALIYVIAFSGRFYSVIRYESMIHEFDPWFNFRTTKYLVQEGLYKFLNWFDDRSWYPLGRTVGGTVYPGLMATAGFFHYILHCLHITLDIREVCVFLAPWMASNTTVVTYLLTKEIKGPAAGLLAAAFIAIVPGYISRSVAGSYDNEGVAIFAMILTYLLWVKAVKTGSVLFGAATAIVYFYMVAAWGGYVFITNIIPLHVVLLLVIGRYSERLYIAYCSFYVLGTLMSMQVFFVGFRVVQTSDHLATHGTFLLLQLVAFCRWAGALIPDARFRRRLLLTAATTVLSAGALILAALFSLGYIQPFSGRFYSMFDPTYASKYIPIIASVSEHQPTTWTSYLFDLHILILLLPVGIYQLFRHLNDASIFLILYGALSVYFSGVMVRLMLVLAPATCVLAAIGLSSLIDVYMEPPSSKTVRAPVSTSDPPSPIAPPVVNAKKAATSAPADMRIVVIVSIITVLIAYVVHCTWVTSSAYSSPSIVVGTSRGEMLDDYREAYYWLRRNTRPDDRIMSWWDYGYQIAGMGNRTTLVDNNTWNNSHIAQVGKAFALPEERSYPILRKLDVDYVLVIFGGAVGYSSDDINKFLWMVRIAGSTDPSIQESDYFADGQYRMDAGGSKTMLNSLMYSLVYYRFEEMPSAPGQPAGVDRVRGVVIGRKGIQLKYLEEAYTTEHWMVRIYRVRPPFNRGPASKQDVSRDVTNMPKKRTKGRRGKLRLAPSALRLLRSAEAGSLAGEDRVTFLQRTLALSAARKAQTTTSVKTTASGSKTATTKA